MEPRTTSTRMGDFATDTMKGVKDEAGRLKDEALALKEKYVDEAWEKTRQYVSDNPAKTILIAAAVGLVLGSFMRRR
jgi:ElaB/YqjD/DUF883 family membrane-anchored ribosome-binding protein